MKFEYLPLATLALVLSSPRAVSAENLASLAGTRNLDTFQAPPIEQGNLYLGLGFGKARNRLDAFDSRYRNRTDSAFKLFAGYAYNKYFAMELAYLGIDTDDGTRGAITVSLKHPSVSGYAVGLAPLSNYFQLMAKVGYASYDARSTAHSATHSDRKGNWAYGIVAAVNLGEHFGIRSEYEAVGVSSDVYDVVSLSGIFKF